MYQPDWQEFAPIYFYESEDQPDLRPKAEEQVPHLLVIESIDWLDAHLSELWVECPLDHHTGRHWCSEDIHVTYRQAYKLVGATVFVNFRALVDCWIKTDVENSGVLEMLGIPSFTAPTPWPDDLPQQPGTYPVRWASDRGWAEDDFRSWLELVQ